MRLREDLIEFLRDLQSASRPIDCDCGPVTDGAVDLDDDSLGERAKDLQWRLERGDPA